MKNLDEIKKEIRIDPSNIKKYNITEDELCELLSIDESILEYVDFNLISAKVLIKYFNYSRRLANSLWDITLNENLINEVLRQNTYIYNFIYNGLTEELRYKYLKVVEKYGMVINEDSLEICKKSKSLALYNVKRYVENLDYFEPEAFTDELLDYAINNGYKYNRLKTSHYLKSNEKMVSYFLKQQPSLIGELNPKILTIEMIRAAFDSGFDDYYNNKLLKRMNYVAILMEKDKDVLNKVNKSSFLNWTKDSSFNFLLSSAFKNKFCFKLIGDRQTQIIGETYYSFGEDIIYADNNNLFLLECPELVLSSFLNGYKDIIFSEKISSTENPYFNYILEKSIIQNIPINTFRNINLLNNKKFKEYFYKRYFNNPISKKVLEKYLNIFPNDKLLFQLNKLSLILDPTFLNEFTENQIYMILKYLIVSNSLFEIDKLLKKFDIKQIKKVYDKVYYSDDSILEILNFKKFVNFFSDKPTFLQSIINSDITDEDIGNLKFIIDLNPKINIYSLSNIKLELHDYYSNQDYTIKDKICYYLCGSSFKDTNEFLTNIINTSKIRNSLPNECNNKYYKYLLIIEEIANLEDETELNCYFQKMKNYKGNLLSLNTIENYYRLKYLEKYKQLLTDIDSQKPTRIEDGVKIYDYTGQDFAFITHVESSFDFGYISKHDITAFFNNNFGRSYLCTSYIDQNHVFTSGNISSKMYAFNSFSDEQFIAMNNVDMYSKGTEDNDLTVSFLKKNFFLPSEMSYLTEAYNEFVFYRQDNSSTRMLPTAIVCYKGQEEQQYDQAKRLNLPIVVIDLEKYKDMNKQKYLEYKNECLIGNLTHLEDLLGLAYKLNQSLTEEEMALIEKQIPNNKLEMFNYLVKLYRINQKETLIQGKKY